MSLARAAAAGTAAGEALARQDDAGWFMRTDALIHLAARESAAWVAQVHLRERMAFAEALLEAYTAAPKGVSVMTVASRMVREQEADFQTFVTDAATALGWLWWHEADSRRDTPGLLDLVLLHEATGDLVFAELKVAGRRLTRDQARTMRALLRGGHDAVVWWPADRQRILDRLGRHRAAGAPALSTPERERILR